MDNVAEAFEIASRHYEAGELPQAEHACRELLGANPTSGPAWNLLGRVSSVSGKYEAAIQCFSEALKFGFVDAGVWNDLGLAFYRLGQHQQAIDAYQRAIEQRPNFPEAVYNLGLAQKDLHRLDEAINSFLRALKLKPDFAQAHYHLGRVYQSQGNWNAAADCYQRALEASRSFVPLYNEIGLAFKEHGLIDQAAACYRRALALKQDYAPAYANLGVIYQQQGNYEEAIDCYRRVIALTPTYAEAYNNLGAALNVVGNRAEAMECYREALKLRPDLPEAHMNLGSLMLLTGDFENGWTEFEWRWKTARFPNKPVPGPLWRGEPIAGKTILLHSEQGLGDTIQFVRYVPLVKKLGARVVLSCQDRLLSLLANLEADEVIGETQPRPSYDVHAPLVSLPRIFQTTLDTIPADTPYLSAPPALVIHYRNRLDKFDGFRIGIAWQGNPNYDADRERSFRLSCFQAVASMPDVRLVSLQRGPGSEQLEQLQGQIPVVDFTKEVNESSGTFADTAALIQNLDLVISPDTAVAHLAGALGIPTWIALPFTPDWRWLLERRDSPWYPTMRLFRQPKRGDWLTIFEEMARSLHVIQ